MSRFNAHVSFAILTLALALAACDASSPCDEGMSYVQGACEPPGTDAGGAADAGSDAAPDALVSDDDSGTADAGGNDAGCPVDDALGESCQVDGDCACGAPYCAKMPGQSAGYCTVRDCNLMPDNCPDGYQCFDLSVFSAALPKACLEN